jgi:hypothetical protein
VPGHVGEPVTYTIEDVQVSADPELCAYVAARGGTLWVRATRHRCCQGGLTLLSASTDRPGDAARYVTVDADLPITVRFDPAHGRPDELVLELRGLVRKRPAAFWDGCAFKI